MAKQFQSFTLVPKQGRGIVTSRSPQVLAEYTDSLAYLSNFLAKDGAWVCRGNDTTSDLIGAATGPVHGIHYYNAIDPTNAAATPVTTYLVHAGQATNETGTSTLYRSDTGAAVTVNGVNFTTTTPSDIFFINIKNRCFIAGTKMGTSVVPTIVTRYPSAASYMWGVNAPVTDLLYDAYTNVTNATTKVFFTANGATVALASTGVAKAAGTNWDPAWAGKTVRLGDVDYEIVSSTTTAMVINPAYADANGTVNIRVQYGEVSWPDIGPKYAYAYYNPTTGHISSISPALEISEPAMSNVRVKISGIQGTNDPNYTRIVIFRTAFDTGGNLLPLKLNPSHGGTATIDNTVGSNGRYMIENTTSATVTYVDFVSAGLGAILGPLQGPLENNPPPADVRYMAFWDQRVWVVPASTRYRLQFSGNSGQIPLGVPEESFPALNFRDVPSDDGFITGLKVVGTSLLVCTERYLYFVNGSSSNDYRLERISTRGSGVDQYAIDEHPGDSSTQSASAVYVSRDKRLWRQYPGGRVEDFGWPIQDKLDRINLNLKKPVILRVCQVGKSWLLALGIRELATPRYGYVFYDFDEETWLDLNVGTPAMWGPGYGGYTTKMWSGVGTGVVYDALSSGQSVLDLGATDASASEQRIRIMGTDTSGFTCYWNSQNLDCGDKQAKKSFQEFLVHTEETDTSFWTAVVIFDDFGTNYTLQAVPDTITTTSPRHMGTQVIRYVLPSSAPPQFHTVKLALKGTSLTLGRSVFKIVLNYTIESTGISGSVT